ncbi:MAG: acyl-CoA synthetase, partial [Mycobacterium sp.]
PRQGRRPTLTDLDPVVRKDIAGYKVPRSLRIVDAIKRYPARKPDYKWAKDETELRPADEVHSKHTK